MANVTDLPPAATPTFTQGGVPQPPVAATATPTTEGQTEGTTVAKPVAARTATPRGPSIHQIYALPVPIRTYPLPTFYPSNPVSLFHVLYTWLSQIILPPASEPSTIYKGAWSSKTRSIHVTDAKTIRALWEQGFFGKGSYSRSEPNWLRREQARKGKTANQVAEEYTNKRREERKLMKWDRARKEQEAIQRIKQQEAWVAPVGPLELLALPNSLQDVTALLNGIVNNDLFSETTTLTSGDVSSSQEIPPGNLTSQPNGITSSRGTSTKANGIPSINEEDVTAFPSMNGDTPGPETPIDDVSASSSSKRRKSVRFSPRVQSTTYLLSDPPSPSPGLVGSGKGLDRSFVNGNPLLSGPPDGPTATEFVLDKSAPESSSETSTTIVDKEHLQLMPEEAFYLSYALGTLSVLDPVTQKPLSVQDLFKRFRQCSYFPPRMTSLQPDDPFVLNYVVYHHFRSLGWIVRPGIKFGVDWLLYHRGPVFSHAEFAMVVFPAYTDPKWEGRQPPQRSWHWLHSINRVQSTALKTLVMICVDIPPPADDDDELDVSTMLKRYKVREFIIKRWLSNRNRD
ncbi:tRNA splicing endonuclease subunit sen2 [Diatrype stigma]|uniref:tRNA-intron lyase n=1 Tax=Diatrype stigma TaxID=117547 RepID=A0AAN9YQD7_9PEZI